jgi:pSer/pThr/pTyr-binding forkhead associated (FHA) protein
MDRPRISQPQTAHWLVLHSGRIALNAGENVVGRDPKCDVWIDAAEISRRHACIVIDDSGARVQDLNSKNGTTVSGTPVRSVAALRDGDRLAFGAITAVFRSSGTGMSTKTRTRQSVRSSTASA